MFAQTHEIAEIQALIEGDCEFRLELPALFVRGENAADPGWRGAAVGVFALDREADGFTGLPEARNLTGFSVNLRSGEELPRLSDGKQEVVDHQAPGH